MLQAVTERIARDNAGINAFAVLDSRALAAAGESTQRWRAGRPIGLLDGVPCTIKDLIDIAGLPTRKGSRTTDPAPAETDAPIVQNLKAAGAVIVGKTTTTEFGWKTPGDCPLHGITRNPRSPRHTTGGSSSGAAAAAAAHFGPLHVGTDAGGSIRIPAAWCGVVGLKPSFGRVPQWPLGAFAPVAVAGPIARTVRDTALMFSALACWDARDPYCVPQEPRDWLAGIEDGVAGLRIAVLRQPGFDAPADSDSIAAVEEAARILAEAGAEIEEAEPDLPDASALFTQLWSTALKLVVDNTRPDRRPLLDAGLLAVAGRDPMQATALIEGIGLQNQAAHAMTRLHRSYDLVLCPTVPNPPPLADAVLDDPVAALNANWAPWTFLFNMTRQPAITVPLGTGQNGLPRSVQFAAAHYRDDLVLRAARAIERAATP
ncbi:MAG: amidase family protein [Acetobacteraceae bacterium]|nr:amidase family protein [Acetobacteraceae bacterium]